jgi:hypothetical protein
MGSFQKWLQRWLLMLLLLGFGFAQPVWNAPRILLREISVSDGKTSCSAHV